MLREFTMNKFRYLTRVDELDGSTCPTCYPLRSLRGGPKFPYDKEGKLNDLLNRLLSDSYADSAIFVMISDANFKPDHGTKKPYH